MVFDLNLGFCRFFCKKQRGQTVLLSEARQSMTIISDSEMA